GAALRISVYVQFVNSGRLAGQLAGGEFSHGDFDGVVRSLAAHPLEQFRHALLQADAWLVAKQRASAGYIGHAMAYIAFAVFVGDNRFYTLAQPCSQQRSDLANANDLATADVHRLIIGSIGI